MLTIDELVAIVRAALEHDAVTAESEAISTEGWDSLGHLTILSKLDESTDGKTSMIEELGACQSVAALAEELRRQGLLRD